MKKEAAAIYGWDCAFLTFVYPSFHCGSTVKTQLKTFTEFPLPMVSPPKRAVCHMKATKTPPQRPVCHVKATKTTSAKKQTAALEFCGNVHSALWLAPPAPSGWLRAPWRAAPWRRRPPAGPGGPGRFCGGGGLKRWGRRRNTEPLKGKTGGFLVDAGRGAPI